MLLVGGCTRCGGFAVFGLDRSLCPRILIVGRSGCTVGPLASSPRVAFGRAGRLSPMAVAR